MSSMVIHKVLDHARTRDDDIVRVGDWIKYLDFSDQEINAIIEKIVHNYGGAVLFLDNKVRIAAQNSWVQHG